jgi:VWFA-related protein
VPFGVITGMKLLLCLATLALATASAQNAPTRQMCMFFDFSSMNAQDQARAQKTAIEFVDKKVAPEDSVALVMFTSELRVIQAFTSDHDTIIAALRKIVPAEPTVDGEVDQLSALQDLAKVLSIVPGKKQLIYFTGGLSKSGIDNQAGLDATVQAIKAANAAIYAMDTRGLMQ